MKLGLIGCGKMGSALLKGILAKKICRAQDVIVRDAEPKAVTALQKDIPGLKVAKKVGECAAVDVILLCVKPADMAAVLTELGGVPGKPLYVSIAAGVTLSTLEKWAGGGARVVRVMPNTPALVGQGASAFATGAHATAADVELVEKMFGAVGLVTRVPEKLMDAVTGLSGSGPAYVYTIIEALTDGGILMGLPADKALQLAAQTVAGAAHMVLETQAHPGVLKHQVTSPGGTTIAGLRELEQGGLRASLIEAVRAASLRSSELGKA